MRFRFFHRFIAPRLVERRFACAACAAVACFGSQSASAQQRPDAERQGEPHREVPDDPPGIPAYTRGQRSQPPVFPLIDAQHPFFNVQVNVDAQGMNIVGDAANEPSIAIDPTDPDHMVIGWRQFDTVQSNFREAGYAYTEDSGNTWTFPGVIENGVFRSDPVLDFDTDGTFYYNSLTSNFRTQVFQSLDQGKTWGSPAFAFGGDKQWMTIDRTGGMGHGHLYQEWSVFAGCCGSDTFNRSTDEGQSFETPSNIPGTPIFGKLDVAPTGTLYVSGFDPNNFSNFFVARSSNAQNAAVTPTFQTTSVNLGGSLAFSVGPNPGGLLGQVELAVDNSGGPDDGNVYILAAIDPPGSDPLDVRFARSTNGGQSFSPSIRINDDPTNNGAWQWFGTMSVAPDGRIDVVWNDTRDSGQTNMSRLYYSFSSDGGLSWAPNRALSPVWNSHVGWPNQNKIGDYYEMISDNEGAHLAWSATFNGEQDVYYMRIFR